MEGKGKGIQGGSHNLSSCSGNVRGVCVCRTQKNQGKGDR